MKGAHISGMNERTQTRIQINETKIVGSIQQTRGANVTDAQLGFILRPRYFQISGYKCTETASTNIDDCKYDIVIQYRLAQA